MSHLCLFASLFLSCDAAPEAALVEGREATVLMQTIEAGLLEWRREVVFRSTYTFRKGMANSVESGLKGEFDPNSPLLKATGVLHKSGSRIRFQVNYDKPRVINPGEAQLRVTNVSTDEVTDGHSTIVFGPLVPIGGDGGDERSGLGGTAVVDRHKDELGERFTRNSASLIVLTPLAPLGNVSISELFAGDFLRSTAGESTLTQKVYREDEHICFVFTRVGVKGHKGVRQLRVWTTPTLPVLVDSKYTITYPDGRMSEYHCRLSDFRQCNGEMVPARVLVVAKPYPANSASVREWKSTDLGEDEPSDEDFVITVPDTTMIGGIDELPPIVQKTRRLDVTTISNPIVTPSVTEGAERRRVRSLGPPLGAAEGTGNWRWGLIVIVNLLIVGAIVAWRLVSRARKSESTEKNGGAI